MAAKILVVDDDEIVFSAFRYELEKEGFEVDTALDGEAAIDKVRSKHYDVVYIDLVMPGMNGIETCRAINKFSPDSKLIAMTGHIYTGLANEELDFIRAGGKIYYLYKPFQAGELLETTKMAMEDGNS